MIPLILTIIIELSVAFLLGFRNRYLFLGVVVVNIITNSSLNFILAHTLAILDRFGMFYILLLEAIVVITEYLMLKSIFKNEKNSLFKLSLIMNTSSFLIGIILFW